MKVVATERMMTLQPETEEERAALHQWKCLGTKSTQLIGPDLQHAETCALVVVFGDNISGGHLDGDRKASAA